MDPFSKHVLRCIALLHGTKGDIEDGTLPHTHNSSNPGAQPCSARVPVIRRWMTKYQPNAESKSTGRLGDRSGACVWLRLRRTQHTLGRSTSAPCPITSLKKGRPVRLRLCGNNYIGDSPLGGWWKDAFEKYQPGIKIEYNLQTAATAIPCLGFGLADIGITHEPSFYDATSPIND